MFRSTAMEGNTSDAERGDLRKNFLEDVQKIGLTIDQAIFLMTEVVLTKSDP